MQKILFIEPPFYRLFKDTYSLDRYPLSLGYLAAAVRRKTDWDAVVYNADFSSCRDPIKVSYLAAEGFDNYLDNLKNPQTSIWKEVRAVISEYKPTIVGISAKSQNFTSSCMVAKLVKEIDEKIIVIVGGPHSSMVGSEVLQCQAIDLAVRGEGEETIVELLHALESAGNWGAINGLIYRKDGLIVENPPSEFIKNLDSLCFPYIFAHEVLRDYDKYPKAAFGYIFATRGCPYDCFFCGSRNIWSRQVRFRTPAHVVDEIKGLKEQGIRLFHFVDDNLGANKRYLNELCHALIKHCPGIKWDCEFHVNSVDDEIIPLMKKAGKSCARLL